MPAFVLALRGDVAAALAQPRLSSQFDAVIHIDETRAGKSLERTTAWERGEAPETYPFAV